MRLSILVLLPAALAWAQPAITPGGVQDAASYTQPLAQGSIFVVKGTNLCPPGYSSPGLPLTTEVNGTSIRFSRTGGGGNVAAWMVYTYNLNGTEQLAGILPSTTPEGSYDVTVTAGGRTSAAERVTVVTRRFGLITANSAGFGRAAALNYVSPQRVDLNRYSVGRIGIYTTSPASPGQNVTLWGTGLGPLQGVPDNVAPGNRGNMTGSTEVKILFAGHVLGAAYAGRSPEYPGLDQINVTLPIPMITGCTLPIQVLVNGVASNAATLSTAPVGRDVCEHSIFEDDRIRKVDAGGTVVGGFFNFLTFTAAQGATEQTSENFIGAFSEYDADQIADVSTLVTAVNACVVYQRRASAISLARGAYFKTLEAGNQVTVAGPPPGSLQAAVPRQADNSFATTFGVGTSYLSGGAYTMSGNGGSQVGNFLASVQIPAPVTWTNRNTIGVIDRNRGVTVTWSGGGNGNLAIVGQSGVRVGGTADDPIIDGTMFVCNSPAAAQTFTVPSDITRQLPATLGINAAGMLMLVNTQRGPSFGARLDLIRSTDAGYLSSVSATAKSAVFGPLPQ